VARVNKFTKLSNYQMKNVYPYKGMAKKSKSIYNGDRKHGVHWIYALSNAATPGNSKPSNISKEAPPPVEM
jgi:hypothetical protein